MHISQLHLWTYDNKTLIGGNLEVSHEGTAVKIQLSENDRHEIQKICVAAFMKERQKIADAILNNSPHFVALSAPEEIEEAEFEPVAKGYGGEDIPF